VRTPEGIRIQHPASGLTARARDARLLGT
jgi:hypothetical protein